MHSVKDTLERFVVTFSALDLDGIMLCFAGNATSFFPIAHHSLFLEGKQEIKNQFEKVISKVTAAGLSSLKLVPEDLKIQEFGDTAIATFHIRDNDLSRRTLVLRKDSDNWLIQHLHASNAPLGETN